MIINGGKWNAKGGVRVRSSGFGSDSRQKCGGLI